MANAAIKLGDYGPNGARERGQTVEELWESFDRQSGLFFFPFVYSFLREIHRKTVWEVKRERGTVVDIGVHGLLGVLVVIEDNGRGKTI